MSVDCSLVRFDGQPLDPPANDTVLALLGSSFTQGMLAHPSSDSQIALYLTLGEQHAYFEGAFGTEIWDDVMFEAMRHVGWRLDEWSQGRRAVVTREHLVALDSDTSEVFVIDERESTEEFCEFFGFEY